MNKAISPKQSTDRGGRAPTNLSDKPQAYKQQATSFRTNPVKPQAKRQASSYEQQASSSKRLMWAQSSSAKQGVSRWSVSRPRIEVDP